MNFIINDSEHTALTLSVRVCIQWHIHHFFLIHALTDNPVNHFPTYQPSEERVAAIQAKLAEEDNPLNLHYDASHEVRAKGAGFYQFSGDEETRRKQMEELRKVREDTEKTRAESGAVDLLPGEVEGMHSQGGASGPEIPSKSRAMEKRKREIEERRKLLDAKRRKKDPGAATIDVGSSLSPASVPSTSLTPLPVTSTPQVNDPFAALEAQSLKSSENRRNKSTNAADDFLASLEHDMMRGQ